MEKNHSGPRENVRNGKNTIINTSYYNIDDFLLKNGRFRIKNSSNNWN